MRASRKYLRHLGFVLILALLLAALSGCEVGPNYKKPQDVVPAQYAELSTPTTQGSRVTSETTQLAQWWSSFRDPELDSLVERALGSNLDLQQAQSRIVQSRYELGIARAPLFPNVTATGGYEYARGSKNITIPAGAFTGGASAAPAAATPGVATPAARRGAAAPQAVRASASASDPPASSVPPGGPQSPLGLGGLPGVNTNVYQAGLDATWELDLFGGTRRNIEAASADVEAAIEDRRAEMISVIGEIARTYVQLRGYQWQAAIARDNVSTQQQTLSIIQDRRRVGVATDLDVSRQSAQLAATQAQIPALNAQIRDSIHALGILLGDDPAALSAELSADAPLPPTPPEVPIGLPSELLRRRPDIRRAERQLAAATARIGAATADLYPQFSLTGQAGLDSTELKKLPRWDSRYFLISPGVSWPIFDAGQIQNNIGAQNELTRQAELSYRQTILQALKEVEDAIGEYRDEQLRRQSLQEAVTADETAVSLAREQYQRGVTDFLTVLDAQRSLLEAQDALAQSDLTIAADLVALYKALGGGWEFDRVGQ